MGGLSMSTRLSLSSPAFVSVAGGGGGAALISGTTTVGVSIYNSSLYGSAFTTAGSNEGLGLLSPTPADCMYRITYDGTDTQIRFFPGTYGSLVITDTTINFQTTIIVTLGGVTQTGFLQSTGGGEFALLSFSGDVFSLVSKNGQTLTFTIAGAGY